MAKKDTAAQFLTMASSGKAREAFEKYIHPDFKHHNAYFKGDRKSLLDAMEASAHTNPNTFIEIRRALEDGELAATHTRVVRSASNDPEIAVVHIFRFKDKKIIEEWEVGMGMPKNSPNENGIF